MGYLRDLYGTRSPEFIRGFLAAMKAYAIWKDGEQRIGCMETKLKEEMSNAVQELSHFPEIFSDEIENSY